MKKYRSLLLLTAFLEFCVAANAQPPSKTAQRLSELKNARFFTIEVRDVDSFQAKQPKIRIVSRFRNILQLQANQNLLDSLLSDKNVLFISGRNQPKEESVINGFDLSLSQANLSHVRYPDISGTGTHVSIKERLPDTTDLDYRDRFIKTSAAATVLNSHATIMSTIAVGAGNTHYTGKGISPSSNLSSATYDNLLPEPVSYYQQNNITVQNHSYGTGVENFYGADAAAYDNTSVTIPYLLHSFSAGNSGDQTSSSGKYSGIQGYANLTGSFKQSKNSIATGSIDSFYNIAVLSSKGPAYDGRVKPELVAFGEDGSSGAAALVSGSALLIQQAYKSQTGQLPDASLIKAVLTNSADDAGKANVDFESGFGSLNTYKAVQTVKENRVLSGTITINTSVQFNLNVPANIGKLKLTLCWTDPQTQTNASKALVNDLDVELLNSITNEKWLPWVLSSYPHKDSLAALAVRKKDTLNNVEQITVDNPSSGNYQITVKGFAVTGTQKFYIAYQFDTTNIFQFFYPVKTDNLIPAANNVIRWNSTFNSSATGTLQISYDEGVNWQTISSAVNLSQRYFKTAIKDTNALGLLRMTINSTNYLSDTFTVSYKPDLKVGLNCSDSAMLHWNRLKGVSQYQLYRYANGNMQSFQTVSDTSAVLKNMQEKIIAVAPLLKTKAGYRSFAVNYTTQGVSCYINNFLVDRVDSASVQLKATLGAIAGVKSLIFEKIKENDVTVLKTFSPITNTFYATIDANLSAGLNTYRVRIELQNGAVVYSQLVTIYQLNNKNYILFPNPLKRNQTLNILSYDFDSKIITLYNSAGQKVATETLKADVQPVRISHLSAGVYTYVITYKGKKETEGKLIIQ